jgi:SAM-dependent methyltransferase
VPRFVLGSTEQDQLRLAQGASSQIAPWIETVLLNIGCGDGFLELRAKSTGWATLSVDPDEQAIGSLARAGIDARVGVIERLPVESATVDVVTATEVFEHLSTYSLAAGLIEISRVLQPGGLLVGTVPYREKLQDNTIFCPECKKFFHRWGHQQHFDESKMQGLLAGRFNVLTIAPRLFVPWNILNVKGRIGVLPKLILSKLRIHGTGENLFFLAEKTS